MSEQVIPSMTVYDDVEAGMDLETEGGVLPPDAAEWRFRPADWSPRPGDDGIRVTVSGRHAALLHAAEALLEKLRRSDFFDIDFGVGLERSDELAALREAVVAARAAAG